MFQSNCLDNRNGLRKCGCANVTDINTPAGRSTLQQHALLTKLCLGSALSGDLPLTVLQQSAVESLRLMACALLEMT